MAIQYLNGVNISGDVGIGTTSPDSKLHVNYDENTGTAFKVTGGGGGDPIASFVRDVGGSGTVNIHASSAHPQINFQNTSTDFSAGAAGTQFRISNASSINHNTLLAVGASGNVGIGTTSPTARLHVTDTGNPTILIEDTVDSNQVRTTYKNTDFTMVTGLHGTNKTYRIMAGNDFNTTANRIANFDGNNLRVSIGNVNPARKLHVIGDNNIVARFETITGSTGALISFVNSTSTNDNQAKLGADPGDGNKLSLWGSNTKTMTLSNGNVGIGTTGPGSKLNIASAMGTAGAFDGAQLRLDTTTVVDTTGFQGIRFETSSAPNYGWTMGANRSSGGRGSFRFYEHNNSATGTERFTILQDGNVGIGVSAPLAELHVNGAVVSEAGNYVAANESVSDAAYVLKQDDKIYSETGAGYLRNLIYHSSNGSIHIGQDGTALITDIVMKPGTSGNVIFRTQNNSETVRISNGGNVGIGNTSPSFPLDVTGVINVDNSGTGAPIILNSSSTGSGGNFLHAKKSDGSNQWVFGANNGGDDRVTIRQYNPASIVFQNNVAEAMVINSAANVGIGTTAPNSKLDILGATNTSNSSLLRVRTTNNPNAFEKVVGFYVNTNTERGYISLNQYGVQYNTSSDYRLKENIAPLSEATERLKLLKPCRFNFIGGNPNYIVDGFLAHEAAEVVPEAVTGDKDAVDKDNNPLYQGIDQSKVVPLLTAALQEAIEKIEQLEIRIQTLENN